MKKTTKFISILLAVVMIVGVLPLSGIITDLSLNTSVQSNALVKRHVELSGAYGFEDLRDFLESDEPMYIILDKTIEYQTAWGSAVFEPIKITCRKILDLNGHSIVVDNVTNASRNKIVAGQYYSKQTLAEGSVSTLFEIDDNSKGDSVGDLTVINSGSATDEYSPLADGSVTIQHTGFPVGNPEDFYAKHYRDYCVRNVFDVINGNLTLSGDFSVVAGQTKEQSEGSINDAAKKLTSSSIGLALDIATTVTTCCSGSTGASSSKTGGNSSDGETPQANKNSEAANAQQLQQSEGASTQQASQESGQQEGQQSGKKQQQQAAGGNTIASSLGTLAKSNSITNFVTALCDVIAPLDSCNQIIWGSCVNVGAGASFVINKGRLYGHGQNDIERDSVISAVAGSVVQINDGEFYGLAGADILHADINSYTNIKKGVFECSYLSKIRLTDVDNKTTVYPGTIGATGITLNMFQSELISDGRMMIKAKILPQTALAEERKNLSALDEAANKSAANKITSQANLVKSQALVKNSTTGKWELNSTVNLPLSSWVEVCPSAKTTAGCTDSLYLTTDTGKTGTVEISEGDNTVLQVWGTDYFSNCLVEPTKEFVEMTTRKTSGYLCISEINPITGKNGKIVAEKNCSGQVQSFRLKDFNLKHGKTYKVTYIRTDKIYYTDTDYICDQAATDMIIRVKYGINNYVEKLDFKSTPIISGKSVEVELDGVDFNETYKSAKVFNCSFEWYSGTTKVKTTSVNSNTFTGSAGQVYCKVTITPTATGKNVYPGFTSLVAQTDKVALNSSAYSKPVIRTQPQTNVKDSFFGSFSIYTDVCVDTDKTAVAYEWLYRTSTSSEWKSVSDLTPVYSDGKLARCKKYVSSNSLATYANNYYTSNGKVSGYTTNSDIFTYYSLGYYQIRLDFKNINKNSDYYFKCNLTNKNGTVTTEEIKIRYNDNTCIGGENLLNPDNTFESKGFSYDRNANAITLKDYNGTINAGVISVPYNKDASRADTNAVFATSLDSLSINLEGNNTVTVGKQATAGTEGFADYFIYSDGNVTFTGDGNLTVKFKNYNEYLTLIKAKKVSFKNTGKISFVFEDNHTDHTDDGKYYYVVPVAADKVEMTEAGIVEAKITRTNKTTAKLKIVDCFVKYSSANFFARVDPSKFAAIGSGYRTKLEGTLTNGCEFIYKTGSTKTNGDATAINNKLYASCNICDYFLFGVQTPQQKKLDNGCAHVEGTPVQENVKEATCTAAGSFETVISCTKCKVEMSRTLVKTEASHAWDEGKVTKAATYTATGSATYTCTVCKKTKTETLTKLSKITEDNNILYAAPETKTSVVDSSAQIKDDGKDVSSTEKLGTGMEVTTLDGKKMTVIVMGDLDGNGLVTTSDARTALRRAIGLESFSKTSPQYIAGQVNGSSTVSATEARTILRGSLDKENPDSWYLYIK